MAEWRKGEIPDTLRQSLIKSFLRSANLGDLISRWDLTIPDEADLSFRRRATLFNFAFFARSQPGLLAAMLPK